MSIVDGLYRAQSGQIEELDLDQLLALSNEASTTTSASTIEAAKPLEEALEIRKRAMGPEHEGTLE
jgi:hypothetical protein